MGLSARDRQTLNAIDQGLSGADPDLAAMMAAFTRMTAGNDMPGPETIRPGRLRRVRARRRAASRVRRPRRPPRRTNWRRAGVLLWLFITIALITVAAALARGGSGNCHSPAVLGCPPHLPAHAAGATPLVRSASADLHRAGW